MDNQEKLLSTEEEFYVDKLRSYEIRQGLTAADANYYIGIKKTVYIFVFAVASGGASMYGMNPISSSVIFGFLQEFTKEEIAFFQKLDKALGESCVVLESARNRKKGIDENHFKRFKGECVHNDLCCNLR